MCSRHPYDVKRKVGRKYTKQIMKQLQIEEAEESSVNKSSVGEFPRAQKIPSTEKKSVNKILQIHKQWNNRSTNKILYN